MQNLNKCSPFVLREPISANDFTHRVCGHKLLLHAKILEVQGNRCATSRRERAQNAILWRTEPRDDVLRLPRFVPYFRIESRSLQSRFVT